MSLAPATARTDSVIVDGVRSPVLSAGPADDTEAVVFVHGVPGRGDEWAGLLGRTGEFVRAVAPDMPGFGAADKPAEFDYTVGGYARHLAGLIDELEVRRVHLVLHDFGGAWGLSWALAHPDAFASVTLIDTGVMPGYRWHRYARIWRTPVLGELFQAGSTRSTFRRLIGRENPRLPGDAVERLYDQFSPSATKGAILKLYRATPAGGLGVAAQSLAALDRPALVVWGTYDAYLPWEYAERQRESFPSARIELLEGHGHWPQLEDPWRVASVVVPFLREQGRGG